MDTQGRIIRGKRIIGTPPKFTELQTATGKKRKDLF